MFYLNFLIFLPIYGFLTILFFKNYSIMGFKYEVEIEKE
jgi:hypothetical protein